MKGDSRWIDRLKGLAICWILLCHVVEKIAGDEYIGNPSVPWPPLAARIAQLRPVGGEGVFNLPLTILRDLGWFGDQGVTLFLILSGFGLTLGLLSRGAPERLDVGAFYRRRFARIYPLWWGAHMLFLPVGFFLAGGMLPSDTCFLFDLAGLRFLPMCFYSFSQAWWYVGVLVQLYAVYPLLWRLLRSRGPIALLLCAAAIGFTAIALGPVLFHNTYLDAWQRGAFLFTRLPEFALGMAAAVWYHADPQRWSATLRKPMTLLLAATGYAVGTGLALFMAGMILAPVLLGASAFVLLFPPAERGGRALAFIGRHSYAIYLVHFPFITALVPRGNRPAQQAVGILAVLIATTLSAWLLERAVAFVQARVAVVRARAGSRGVAVFASCFLFFVFGLPLVGEATVRVFDPQEVLGWGERRSLQPDARFGWTLVPSQVTRLRWVSYDYRVTANVWGFPAPGFAEPKPPNALRVLVTGDAYSSAEGLDTAEAWPRLLQERLTQAMPGRSVQVANLSITGYGPNEEAAVVRAFAPRLRPDVVLVEMFVNDVSDVLISDETFRRSIGFALPAQDSVPAFLHYVQLRKELSVRVTQPLFARLHHVPNPEGYFLGNFIFLERGHPEYDIEGVNRTAQRYAEIVRAAQEVHAKLYVMLVPAPAQVCDRSTLAYYPEFVDLRDPWRYDLTLPEARAQRISQLSGAGIWDIGDTLRRLPECPYQPRNMHFTRAGHRAVAEWAASLLERGSGGDSTDLIR